MIKEIKIGGIRRTRCGYYILNINGDNICYIFDDSERYNKIIMYRNIEDIPSLLSIKSSGTNIISIKGIAINTKNKTIIIQTKTKTYCIKPKEHNKLTFEDMYERLERMCK
jgi:hypothetical protein